MCSSLSSGLCFHDPGNWLPAHIMVLTQYGVTARAGVCFPDVGDFLGIKSFFPFPCLLSNRPIMLSSCHLLPFFLLLYLVFAFLPPTEAFRRGGRDLDLKLEWAHSGPFVSLPCVLLKMLALTVRSWARVCAGPAVLSLLACSGESVSPASFREGGFSEHPGFPGRLGQLCSLGGSSAAFGWPALPPWA